jgi:hypothetical protein
VPGLGGPANNLDGQATHVELATDPAFSNAYMMNTTLGKNMLI